MNSTHLLRRSPCRLPLSICAIAMALAGCATGTPPRSVTAPLPTQWFAPMPAKPVDSPATNSVNSPAELAADRAASLPHNGRITDLTQWWQQQGDPVLVDLIAQAQAVSPSVASARARIEQARATQTAAGAALGPALDGSAGVSRSRSQPFAPGVSLLTRSAQAGLQASWELDVFGGQRATRNAAIERLAGSDAQWHDARVSSAAEVANRYFAYQSCREVETITRLDAESRRETARLTDLSQQAGFTAPAVAALARASAAEARVRLTEQNAQCDIDIKALVALTAVTEPDLRQKLLLAQSKRASIAPIFIANVPADALAQRPDVFNAAREVAAASFEIGSAQAERYPRLGLTGSVGTSRTRSSGVSTDFNTWSIGPLSLTVPLFDGRRRAANLDAARTRYDEAASIYRAAVRQAVREVEEALVSLQSTATRQDDAQTAVEGYRASFSGTEALYKSGLASLIELENTRRTLLNAQTTLATLEQSRRSAWVALYRAMGGGWRVASAGSPSGPAESSQAANHAPWSMPSAPNQQLQSVTP